MKEIRYSAKIEKAPFTFVELKKASALALQGLNSAEIKEKVLHDNIFQLKTEDRKREMAAIVLKRMRALDDYLLQLLAHGHVGTGKLIALIALMKTDRLFFEFMNEVFKEKLLLRDYTIADKDFHIFFARKKEQSRQVAGWHDYTFYKLKQVYIRVLFEAGLMKNQKSREIIRPPGIDRGTSFSLTLIPRATPTPRPIKTLSLKYSTGYLTTCRAFAALFPGWLTWSGKCPSTALMRPSRKSLVAKKVYGI